MDYIKTYTVTQYFFYNWGVKKMYVSDSPVEPGSTFEKKVSLNLTELI